MPRVYIALGSNLGNRKAYLSQAEERIQQICPISKIKMSPVYQTDPVGGPKQGKYLNAVLQAETDFTAKELLAELLKIEEDLGRKRSVKNAPRTIDLDLLFYGNQIISESGLTIPHPRLHERDFVLRPLADLAPDWVHPGLGKTINELLKEVGSKR